MKYKVKCPKCGQKLELDDDNLQHRRGVCPTCDNTFYVSELLENAGYQNAQRPSAPEPDAAQSSFPQSDDSESSSNDDDAEERGGTSSIFMRLLDVNALIKWLDSGRIIKTTAGTMFQFFTIVQAIVCLVFWLLSFIALKNARFMDGIAFLIWQVGLLYANYMAFRVQFHRVSQIKKLPDADYVITPIIGLLLTAAGEACFVFLMLISLPLAILLGLGSMISSSGPLAGLPFLMCLPFGGSQGLVPAMAAFLACILLAFLFLIITRWLREWLLALLSIATDINTIKTKIIKQK